MDRHSLTEQYEKNMEQKIAALLNEVRSAFCDGRYSDAQNGVVRLRQLQQDVDKLERQIQIWRQFSEDIADAQLKKNRSCLGDAVASYQRAFGKLLKSESGLPRDVLPLLRQLLGFHCSRFLDRDEPEEIYNQLYVRLIESEFGYILVPYLKDWFALVQRYAIYGMLSSLLELGTWTRAYLFAQGWLRAYPNDDVLIRYLITFYNALVKQVMYSIQKRIERAHQAAERGAYETALKELAEIEERVVAPIEENEKLVGVITEEIDDLRFQAKMQAEKLRRLSEIEQKLLPLKEDAFRALMSKNLAEAQAAIDEARLLDERKEVIYIWIELDDYQ